MYITDSQRPKDIWNSSENELDKPSNLVYSMSMTGRYVIMHEELGSDGIGARLCKDGKFRNFANWGTYKECVKVYNTRGWALRKQTELDNRGVRVAVVLLHKSMDACGRFIEE